METDILIEDNNDVVDDVEIDGTVVDGKEAREIMRELRKFIGTKAAEVCVLICALILAGIGYLCVWAAKERYPNLLRKKNLRVKAAAPVEDIDP